MSVEDEVRAGFRARTGREPSGVWAAPGRVNVVGEHTDYNDGFVLPMAVARRVVVAAAPARGPRSRVWSCQGGDAAVEFAAADVAPADVRGWGAYAAGVFWALRAAGHDVPELDVVLSGDLPAGAGLASSAAVECGLACALADLGDLRMAPTELALAAQRAENDFVGVPTGVMDQLAAMHGRRDHLVHVDIRALAVEHVPFDPAGHGLALLVVDTRARRALAEGEYAQRRSACETAARLLGVPALRDVAVVGLEDALARLPAGALRDRTRHVVTENDRVRRVVELLGSGADPRRVGPLLTASHASLRADFAVSVPELDVAVQAALSAGAHGARMTGAGFGGCVVALVDEPAVAAVTAAVERAFGRRGFGRPEAFVATPSDGARRLA